MADAAAPGEAPAALSAKHEAVAQAYFADPARVGWKAYVKVYPKSSQVAAEAAFSRLKARPEFAARLEQLKALATDSTVMSLHEVLQELSKLGRSNLKHCIVGGEDTAEVIASLRDLPDEAAAAIQELTVETYVEGSGDTAREVKRVKLKLHDKRGPLSELRRHHEPDKHELTGKDGGPIAVEQDAPSPLELARRIAFAMQLGQREAAAAREAARKPGTPAPAQPEKPERT